MTLEGGCLCGHIRFVTTGEAHNPHTCSCSMCRRHSGAFGLPWLEFGKDQVNWTGPGGQPALYRSSKASSRAFCPVCGSTIGAVDDEPVIALCAGLFEQLDGAGLDFSS